MAERSRTAAWTRAGLREIAGYVLIAAALADIYLWRQRSWLSVRVERVRRWRELPYPWQCALCLALAIALLAWGASVEGSQIAATPAL